MGDYGRRGLFEEKKLRFLYYLTVLVCLVSGISSAVSKKQNNEMTNMQLKNTQPEILHIKQISDTNFSSLIFK